MKKSLLSLLSVLLTASLTAQEPSVFGDAKWIGSLWEPLYSDYLPQFRISWKVQLEKKSERLALLFGGNDPRLMNRNMNILGVENGKDESYMKLELDAANASLSVWRVNYTVKGAERLQTFVLGDFDSRAIHTVEVACCLGVAEVLVDGRSLGKVTLTPMKKGGGDYIAFPQLGDIGYEMEAGQRARIYYVKVRNYRSPHGLIYCSPAQKVVRTVGHKKKAVRVLEEPSHGSMPLLRSKFKLKLKPVREAVLTATARGIYKASLNGTPVGADYFAPGISQYNRTHYYQQYDVTKMLQLNNELRVRLGEGWWAGGLTYWGGSWNHFGDRSAFIARLVVRYEDGDSTVITTQPSIRPRGYKLTQVPVSNTDTLWEVHFDSKVTYASMFQGEVCDNTVDEDGGHWQKAALEIPLEGHLPIEGGGTLPRVNDYSSFKLEPDPAPVVLHTTLQATSVNEVRPGVFIYDMGQNMAGFPSVTFRNLKSGQQVTLRYAEVLYPALPEYGDKAGTMMLENIRAAMAQDIFIARGDTAETFTPDQTLHGYRYLEITGIERPLPPADVRGMVVSSVDRFTADFECSNPLVNRLWKNIQWSMLANFISIPTDCPQRNERMGWSGDISVFSRTAVNMADVDKFLTKHMQSMRDVQTPEGRFPDVAPVGGGFGGLLWGSAGITVPWECWLQYGDRDILRKHYDAMKAYIDYLDSHYFDAETGLLVQERKWSDLGDWLGLEDRKNDKTLLFEAYYIYDLDIMRQTARLLGREDDALRYEARMNERKQFFITTYIDPETGRTLCSAFDPNRQGQPVDIQGSYVLPLAFNIVKGELRQKLTDNLVAAIERSNTTDTGVECPPYSLMTGFITTAWISRALSDNGRSDVAYRLLQQTSYPSWLYPVTQGATTIWERLNSYTHTDGFGGNNSMNSFNHYSFGAVGQWLVNRCLGIERDEQEPGYRHFILRPEPDPTGQMTYAKGHLDTRYGRIESSWTRESDGSVSFRFVIPEGTSATLLLPGQTAKEIGSGTWNYTIGK